MKGSRRPPSDDARSGSSITELFLEYLRAHEEDREPDEEALLRRAGEHGGELRSRIALFQSVQGLARRYRRRDELVSARFDRFELVSLIAEGGMGTVYLAEDPELGRRVALKVLHSLVQGDGHARELLLNEARSLGRLEHPGVVRVHQIGSAAGRDFIVMEHVAGPSLSEVVAAMAELRGEPADTGPEEEGSGATDLARSLAPPRERVRILLRIAEALAYCHGCGVVHRDVKPSNVLFSSGGAPVLIDFGLAHLAEGAITSQTDITSRLVGTPAYVAPEQVESGRTGRDPRSDQFSFAVLCYELLTLRNPFQRETRTETLKAIAEARPERLQRLDPTLPREAEQVVLKGLELEPGDRYPSMAAMAADLRAVLEYRPLAVAPSSPAREVRLWLRRNRRRVLLAGIGGLLVLATWIAAAAIRTARLHGSIRARLAAIDPAALDNPIQIAAAGRELGAILADAEELDGPLARLIVREDPRAEPARRIAAWSRRFRTLLGSEIEDAERRGQEFRLPIAWSRVLDVEQLIHPSAPDEEGYWERGKVVFPAPPDDLQVVLFEQTRGGSSSELASGTTAYREIPATDTLMQGVYRLQAWRDPDGPPDLQLEFVVTNEWGPPLRLRFREPAPEHFRRTLTVPHSRRELEVVGLDQRYLVDVPAFRIDPAAVTSGELAAFLRATGARAANGSEVRASPEEPAWVDQTTAMAYAGWAGGRLPTVAELDVAASGGVLDLSSRRPSIGEWVSDLPMESGIETAGLFRYGHYERYSKHTDPLFNHLVTCLEAVPRTWRIQQADLDGPPDQETAGVCFRIVFSNGGREQYALPRTRPAGR